MLQFKDFFLLVNRTGDFNKVERLIAEPLEYMNCL